jgi:hypothetical protein
VYICRAHGEITGCGICHICFSNGTEVDSDEDAEDEKFRKLYNEIATLIPIGFVRAIEQKQVLLSKFAPVGVVEKQALKKKSLKKKLLWESLKNKPLFPRLLSY